VQAASRTAGAKPGPFSPLTGDLVLFDAINEGQLVAFKQWAEMRLNTDLAVITGPKTDAEKLAYLRAAPKLVSFASGGAYKTRNDLLDKAIRKWFTDHAFQLGKFEAPLRANFVLKQIAVDHEELMRGAEAGKARGAAGGILDALKALHRP
jgi:hypothetical protein